MVINLFWILIVKNKQSKMYITFKKKVILLNSIRVKMLQMFKLKIN